MYSVRRKGRRDGGLKAFIPVCTITGLLIIFSGCASTPKRPVSDLWNLLPDGQSVYFSSRIGENRELIRSILKESLVDASMLLVTVDRTDSIVLSTRLENGKLPWLSIIASGNFPEALIGWSMFWDRDWEKKNVSLGGKDLTWWESSKDKLQMSVAKNSLLSVSNGKIEDLLTNSLHPAGPVLPEAALETGNRSDFFVFIPNPAEVLTGGIADSRVILGMNSFWMGLEQIKGSDRNGTGTSTANADKRNDGDKSVEYFVHGAFVLRDERAARVYSALIKVALAAWMNNLGIGNLKTVQEQLELEINGVLINFSGLRIPENALRKMVSDFLKDAVPEGGAD